MRFPAALANTHTCHVLTGDTVRCLSQITGVPSVAPTSGAATIAAAKKIRQRFRFVNHGPPGLRLHTIVAATSASPALAAKY